ncbi:hypothetical protein F4779DRAFT_614503 [Xylariaceae sp. FL0662B]|nr:hypothetical protein F4779DRAFT_614503 [Xylariaceae sp. FL0662B]
MAPRSTVQEGHALTTIKLTQSSAMSLIEYISALTESLAKANLVPGSASGLSPAAFQPTTKLESPPNISFASEADVPTPDDLIKFALSRHYVLGGLQPRGAGQTAVALTKPTLTPYLGPGPKDEWVPERSEPHRYLFLLFRGPKGHALAREDVGDEELIQRRSFDPAEFAQSHGLRLVGVKWMMYKALLQGSTGYNASLSSYFSPQAAAVHSACFVAPQTVTEVSVKSLTSSDNGGPRDFVIRGGGHTWFAGANSTSDGITIDLRRLNSVVLSADKSSVSVGVLTLGGGISYFGPREGWTCNQATSFEVVLADGSVVGANEKQNADLWWGLRGGSNNFGIVTRINLKTFEQDLLWSTLTLNPLTEVDNQARIYSELMVAENYDGFIGQQGLSAALNQLIYTRLVDNETPAFYKPILDLPTIPDSSSSAVVANTSTLAQNSAARSFMADVEDKAKKLGVYIRISTLTTRRRGRRLSRDMARRASRGCRG